MNFIAIDQEQKEEIKLAVRLICTAFEMNDISDTSGCAAMQSIMAAIQERNPSAVPFMVIREPNK